ncbi:short transient receptor potential channel 5-like [Actinia tenebrosa]|uniref:Short transient receptor potential channel 5-like n=1 Tax=Actinia tenebrosa TaxID=6105 RepID=A0A6P8IAT8_ACTTE|nr:short transient receptor potential channel 5-like [Actinia tenebrosa]
MTRKRSVFTLGSSHFVQVQTHFTSATSLFTEKNDNTISNPLYYLLDMQQKLHRQAWIDDEFKDDYESLSDQCENFMEELMNQCCSISEKKMLTNVLPDIKKERIEKFIVIHSKRHEVRDLSFLNLALKTKCDKLIAHPFNQLQLNSVVYPNIATWRKRSVFSVFMFTLRHFLLLPLLAIVNICSPCENGITRYMDNPMIKFMSHFWSMLSFVVLLVVSCFQDKFDDELVKLSIPEWMILLWVAGFAAQALVELSTQGFYRYFAQWWNWVMIAMIIVFSTSYSLRLIAYGNNLNWDVLYHITYFSPSIWYKLVLVANSLFSIAMVLSFVRLSVVFQVNDVIGPWQLSLYHLILDVIKFMLFFSIFFVAFDLSLRKLYSHYVITQRYIAKTSHNGTNTETGHTFSSVGSGAYDLFWSIFGYTDPQIFQTKDPNFTITRETGVFLFGLFQVLAVIVAVNMLIAMMTKSFENITSNATKKWKVSRTRIWMFWVEEGSSLPPPFNLLIVLRNVFKKMKETICQSSPTNVNIDYEMARQTTSNGNHQGRDKAKTEIEREKIRVMLRRYIENERKIMGLPKSTLEQEIDIETAETGIETNYSRPLNQHDNIMPISKSETSRHGKEMMNLSFTEN